MWDTSAPVLHRSHDLPCFTCGHAAHSYLPCSDKCTCTPTGMPGGGEYRAVLAGSL